MEKLLPQNIEAEEGVLGSALIDPEVPSTLRWLEPDDFYREAHRLIWRTMQKLCRQGTRADLITLCNALERAGQLEEVGGAATIAGLVNGVPTSANVGYYAEIVANLSLARRAIHAAGQIAALAYHEHDPVELRRKALDLVVQATRSRGLDRARPLSDVLAEVQEETYRRMEGQIADHLLLTGYVDLDRALVGMEPGQLVLLAGRPRMGKCLAGTTLLDDPQTGARLAIADFVSQHKTSILGLSEQNILRETPVTHWVCSGEKMCYRVRTRTGRSIEATEQHPFLTVRGWTPLSALQQGEAIAVPVSVPVFGQDTSWPLSLVRLLAYYIAEGNLTNHSPRFTNTDPVLVEDFKHSIAEHFPQCIVRQYDDDYMVSQPRIKGAPFRIPPNPVGTWLGALGLKGKLAEQKHLPACVWTWERSRLVELLRILMSCDGTIYALNGAPRIEFTVASEALAQDVQHALVRLGTMCKLWKKTARSWRVEITEASAVQRYQQEVGWLGEKAQRFETHVFNVRKRGNNNGHIPASIWPHVRAAAQAKGYSLAALAYVSGETTLTGHAGYNPHARRNLPRYRLARYASVLGDHHFQAIASQDIYWDEVVSIEAVGEQEVYDLCVPDGSNFVAQDIVVHNSSLGQAILLNVARQLKAQGATVDYVTLEMTAQQQVRRMLSAKAELNTQAIRSGFRDLSGPLGPEEIDEAQFSRFCRAVEALNGELGPTVYLQEQGLSVEELQDHLIQVVSSRDCRFCLVDQLDLFAEPRPRQEQEQIAHISKTLKQLAKDLHIVLLCLVQLNRAVEHRTALLDRRPILSDLRYSGRLEQDADTVLFVHQPCLYQAIYPLPPKAPNPHWNQYTEVIAAKVRDGLSGEVLPLCFTGSFASFSDWPRAWELPQFEE